MPGLRLTVRDEAVLDTLTRRVRCLSMAMVAEMWWSDGDHSLSSARRRLRQLEQAGWVRNYRVFAKPPLELMLPVIRWQPSDPLPDFGPLAYRLQRRFAGTARQTPIVIATLAAAKRSGGTGGRAPRDAETTHDLALATVYLRLLRTNPTLACGWQSEAFLARHDDAAARKLPDALIVHPDGRETVIELGGEYSPTKLAAFHQDCARLGRGYEVW